jgi:predicted MFS family arabinose efflux permease
LTRRRFASLVGVSMLIGNLGSVLAGAPLSWLAQITGWRGVFVGLAAVSCCSAGCWWLLRETALPGSLARRDADGSSRASTARWSSPGC